MDAEQKIIILVSFIGAIGVYLILPSLEITYLDAIYKVTETTNSYANFIRDIFYFIIIPFIAFLSILESAVTIRKRLLGV